MRFPIARAAMAALVLVAVAAAAPRLAWKEYTSADGGFAVLMPADPEIEVETTKTDLGPVEIHSAKCVTESMLCVVKYYDAPSVTDATRDKFLDDNCDGFVRGTNLLQKGERKRLVLGPHPGREVVGETQDGRAQLTARYYVVGKRVYLVMVGSSVDDASSPEVIRYLTSFRLLEIPAGHAPGV